MIDKVEHYAPHWFIALVVIVCAIAVILWKNPIHNICDTQKSAYVKAQSNFLGRAKGLRNYSYYDSFFKTCLKTNNAGGCEPYFRGIETALNDFLVLDDQCTSYVANRPRLKNAFQSFLVQVTRLAWGDAGPESLFVRSSWLTAKHLQIFCRVKSNYIRFYGQGSYQALVKQVWTRLPNKNKLNSVQIKERSLFRTPCSKYL